MGRPRLAARPAGRGGVRLMGALIISRYPRHRLGWLLCAASLLSVTLADRCLQHLGARRGRSRFRVLGPRGRLGGTVARLAGVHRADHGLPHSHRTATCSRPAGAGPSWVTLAGLDPAHARDADDPSRRGRGGRGVRQPRSVAAAAHGRLDARRGRSDRLGRLLGAAAAAGEGRRAAAAAVDRVGGRAAGARRRGASSPSLASRARREPGWRPCRCGSPRSRCPSAWRSRCCATGCSRST